MIIAPSNRHDVCVKETGKSCEIDRSLKRSGPRECGLSRTPSYVVRCSFLYHRSERGRIRECGPKIRIECNVRSSTEPLRDRRLNSLYRRIIANENIGCAGLQIAAARVKCTIGRPFDPFHSVEKKKYSSDLVFRFVSKLPSALVTIPSYQ